jgi:ketosteroid isomerase-like protein
MMPTLERQHCPQVVGAPDHALGHDEDDLARVRLWFQRLQLHVQSVDYVGARPLFAEHVVTFGTFSAFTIGRKATEKEQWRHIWSRIDGFRWRLDDLRVIISGDRRTAVGMALFESVGYTAEGTPFDRPGRCTVVLGRRGIGTDWVAQHIHASLFQGIPARSFGTKPEHRPAL